VEKKPAPPAPAPPQVAENTAPAPQPSAAPAARNLIAAVPISQASPAFPELALRTRASGTVVLDLQIDEQGKVVKATAISGPVIFHSAAITAALKWRYKPASIGGVSVRSQSRVTMDFNLKK
jgi:protein TonB